MTCEGWREGRRTGSEEHPIVPQGDLDLYTRLGLERVGRSITVYLSQIPAMTDISLKYAVNEDFTYRFKKG